LELSTKEGLIDGQTILEIKDSLVECLSYRGSCSASGAGAAVGESRDTGIYSGGA